MQKTLVNAAIGKGLVLALVALSTACDVEDASDAEGVDTDEALGVAEQEFTGYVGSGTRISSNGVDVNVLLGTDTGATGFLTALAGNMDSNSAFVSPDFGSNWDQMRLLVYSHAGTTLRADGTLVYPGTREGGRSYSQTSGTQQRKIDDATPNKNCYITSVCGANGQFFNSADDSMAIVKEGNAWYLKMTGSACGTAYCSTFSQNSWWAANSEGTHDLGPADQGKACFLTGIKGRFRSNDFEDGVIIGIKNGRWQLKVSAGKWGGAACAF